MLLGITLGFNSPRPGLSNFIGPCSNYTHCTYSIANMTDSPFSEDPFSEDESFPIRPRRVQ